METNTPLFDRTQPVAIRLRRDKLTVSVDFPTDEQLAKRHRQTKTFVKKERASGGTAIETQGLEDANLALYEQIRRDDTELDDAQASKVMEHLLKADVDDEPQRVGDAYRIPLTVFAVCEQDASAPVAELVTFHTLRVPTEKELRNHTKQSYQSITHRRATQIASNPFAIADFYDLLSQGVEGYAAEVPVVHKMAIVAELKALLDEAEAADQDNPENFPA